MDPLRTVLLYTVLSAAVVTRLHPAQEPGQWGEGANVVTQLPGPVYDWSADGRRLAYADRGGISLIEVPTFDVRRALLGQRQHRAGADAPPRNRRMAASGGEAVALSRPGWTDSEIPIRQILWSPDGKRLAFVAPRREDGWDTIWLAEIAGSGTRDLLPPAASAQFRSPGVRAVGIEAWLSGRDLVFS
jgi:dipeptidyl aminopeptidase/acylaminoacyl peptidase